MLYNAASYRPGDFVYGFCIVFVYVASLRAIKSPFRGTLLPKFNSELQGMVTNNSPKWTYEHVLHTIYAGMRIHVQRALQQEKTTHFSALSSDISNNLWKLIFYTTILFSPDIAFSETKTCLCILSKWDFQLSNSLDYANFRPGLSSSDLSDPDLFLPTARSSFSYSAPTQILIIHFVQRPDQSY